MNRCVSHRVFCLQHRWYKKKKRMVRNLLDIWHEKETLKGDATQNRASEVKGKRSRGSLW